MSPIPEDLKIEQLKKSMVISVVSFVVVILQDLVLFGTIQEKIRSVSSSL